MILIVAIALIVRACLHNIAGIARVLYTDSNDRNDHMETRLYENNHVIKNPVSGTMANCIEFLSINSGKRMGLQHFKYFIANFCRDLSPMLPIETCGILD